MGIKVNLIKEWNDQTHIVMVPIEIDGWHYCLYKYSKDTQETSVQLYSVGRGRVPAAIKSTKGYYTMALALVADNYNVTPKTARDRIKEVMQKNEVLVDWILGHYYYKKRSKIIRKDIKEYKLENVLMFWDKSERVSEYDENSY